MSDEDHNSDTTQVICDELNLDSTDELLLTPYVHQARWISQSIHPFISIQRVFYAGFPESRNKVADGLVDTYSEEEVRIFNAIMNLQHKFREVVSAAATNTNRFLLLIRKFTDASCASRVDDTSKLKNAILDYIYENPTKGSTFPPELQDEKLVSDSKSLRGFQNIETAYHLCPLKFKAAFEENPRAFLRKIEDGSTILTAHDLPSFLYDRKTSYNEHDEVTGLFRGFLLVRVYRHIFTGPSTAMNPTHNVPKSKAKMFNLEAVTGRTIAYACVQTYIALSTMPKWGNADNQFRLDTLYDDIVSMFEENADNPWVEETLSWWNAQVPGLRSKVMKATTTQVSKAGPSAANRIAAQLHARANQQSPRQSSPSQAPLSCQQQWSPLHPHSQASLPALCYHGVSPLSVPQQVSSSRQELSHQNPQHSRHQKRPQATIDYEQEWPYRTGRLTSTVNWGKPHCLENGEWHKGGGDVQVPIVKKRKVAVPGSKTESESQYMEDHEMCELEEQLRKEGKCWIEYDKNLQTKSRFYGHSGK